MSDALRERLTRTAYLDLSAELGLTIMPGPDGLPLVPAHWRDQAEAHARAALNTTCPDLLDDGLRDYACGKRAGHTGSCGDPAGPDVGDVVLAVLRERDADRPSYDAYSVGGCAGCDWQPTSRDADGHREHQQHQAERIRAALSETTTTENR